MTKTKRKFRGTLCGILAAICYGTNPLGALFLYQDHVNTNTVLTHRFSLAALLIGSVMLLQKESFRITRHELGILASLGILFAVSSMTLYSSFLYMDAGIASTLLFVYPIMVAIIMWLFFKEKASVGTFLSTALAFTGIALLYKTGQGSTLSTFGIMLVMLSSLSYAVYIVIINRSSINLPPMKMTFYVLLFCSSCIFIHSFFSSDTHIHALPTIRSWGFALMLAIVPTFLSLTLMTVSIRNIGSTPFAIMGALEPLTAVVIGVTVFAEDFTGRMCAGIILILLGVTLIIVGNPYIYAKKISRARRIQKKRTDKLHNQQQYH